MITALQSKIPAAQFSPRKLLFVSPFAMLVSASTNLLLYYAAGSVFPEVSAWPGAGAAQVVAATFVYLLMATAVFALIIRRASRPARTYLIVAVTALLVSLALPVSAGFGFGPPGVPVAELTTVAVLSLMHLVTFALSTALFNRLARV